MCRTGGQIPHTSTMWSARQNAICDRRPRLLKWHYAFFFLSLFLATCDNVRPVCDVHQNQDVMSNKRHPDGRAGLPSAAVVLNKCMTFLFFFPLVYGDLLYFLFFYESVWRKHGRHHGMAAELTICLILSFCPHCSFSLSGCVECVSVCLAVTVAAGWGHKLCVLVRRLWVRKETEGEKRARSAALLFQWLSKISERKFFFVCK